MMQTRLLLALIRLADSLARVCFDEGTKYALPFPRCGGRIITIATYAPRGQPELVVPT